MKLFLSQEAFAKEIGISFTTVNRWGNGRGKPNLEMEAKFKDFYEKTTSYLKRKNYGRQEKRIIHFVPDVDRVKKETSLTFVKEKLDTMPVWKVPYSIHQENKIVHKLTSYSYFDEAHKLIMCVMEDVSDIYNQIKV